MWSPKKSIRVDGADLVPVGIQTEDSDYRIHVCSREGFTYTFPRLPAVEVMKKGLDDGRYEPKAGGQAGVDHVTYLGIPVPIHDLIRCVRTEIPQELLGRFPITPWMRDTSEKGRRAAQIAIAMMKMGLIVPERPKVKDVEDLDLQLSGVDVIIYAKSLKIQVKCDYLGGIRESGNLFFQIAESNPLKKR